MEKFVELNRTFAELPIFIDKVSYNEDKIEKSLPHSADNKIWNELLDEYRIVLLAEAGAGKTIEIKNAAKYLRKNRKNAFFLRLEFITDDFEIAFEVGSNEQFQDWLNSNEEGWLLLDSVDEARLKDPSDFEKAIRKLGKKIENAISRVHIIITSRGSVWRPNSDLNLCENNLPFKNSQKENNSENKLDNKKVINRIINQTENITENNYAFKIFKLNDLNTNQIKTFVIAKGIKDVSKFLDDIERQDAWMFTSRPQDLDDIVVYWNKNGKIGSRLDLVEHNVERRLIEREQNRADKNTLSLVRASEGVGIIAAASSFMNVSMIKVPDGALNSKGIDIKLLLTDWIDKDHQAILSRPIFDEANYGTVRFHHRSVREYLTAKWLFEKLQQHGSRKKIENLFFRNQYGVDVIVPSMKPVLSWLVLLDSKIRKKTYNLEPEIILDGGDPTKLDLKDRNEIIQAVCENISFGSLHRSFHDRASMRRFVSEDLGSGIKELLEKYKHNDRVIYYLLSLVWQGSIKELLPEAKKLALNTNTEKNNRIISVRIMKEIGSKNDFKELLDGFQAEDSKYDRYLFAELINGMDSNEESVNWIIGRIDKVGKKEKYDLDSLISVLATFISRSNFENTFKLIQGIDPLLKLKPVTRRRDCEISQANGWLMQVSVRAVEKLIVNKSHYVFNKEAMFILVQLPTFQIYRDFGALHFDTTTIKAIQEWKEFNHVLFWYNIEQSRNAQIQKGEKPPTSVYQLMWRSYWDFDVQDFEIIKSDILYRYLEDDRLIALTVAFQLYTKADRPIKWKKDLKEITSSEESLKNKLDTLLNPPPMSIETRKWKRQDAQWKRREQERERKSKEKHLKDVKFLNVNLDILRDNGLGNGQIMNCQSFLYNRMHEKNKKAAGSYSIGNWEDLIVDYGEDVAMAFKDGLINFWRKYTPMLYSELGVQKDKKKVTYWSTIFGLSGLEVELSESLENISEYEAELACRYAVYELNSFPNWFHKLYLKFPNKVFEIIRNEIKWELEFLNDESYVLSRVSWSSKWIHDSLAPELILFLDKEPLNTDNLVYALKIIQSCSSSVSDNQLALIAERKVKELNHSANRTQWLACWLGVEPQNALPFFVNCLNDLNIKDSVEAKNIAMKVIVELVGERTSNSDTRGNYRTPEYLKELYILMHQYIKIEDDIIRAGRGAYSPELRDDAQEARNRLFGMLSEIPGKNSYLTMIEILKMNLVPDQQYWMNKRIRERVEFDSENVSWNESKFEEFNRSLESTPSNHRELFDLAIQRLEDLKYWLEEGDDSIASTLAKETEEKAIRRFIANWCNEKSSGKYYVSQEEELADDKKPDCRFIVPELDAPVPMELKIVDNKWSGNELFERLENQLNNDYLRDQRTNRGIFILVYRGEQKTWKVKNRVDNVTFPELVEALQDHWNSLQNDYPKVEQIKVIGIDLTKRLQENRPQRNKLVANSINNIHSNEL